jgi:very-short-patch-repair endonuclease
VDAQRDGVDAQRDGVDAQRDGAGVNARQRLSFCFSMVSRFINAADRKSLRRALRRTATLDERLLWNLLKGSRFHGRKFRRQTSIGPYVADFYCPAEKLIVELDGASHDTDDAEARDAIRDQYLRDAGFRVLRLLSGEVRRNPEGILLAIAEMFATEFATPPRQAAPATPPRGGGDKT